jgi:hypothetical protein
MFHDEMVADSGPECSITRLADKLVMRSLSLSVLMMATVVKVYWPSASRLVGH